ncbi:MAG TPA: calcium-binding protein, partial [Campylobacterales bacterium]|nr:calcium-binding protein [Campylobacterales bacterium]
MAENQVSHVAYGDQKVTLVSAPEKDVSISVFAKPGDKISFEFDISKANFKMVGGDVVLRMPDGGEIIFVSMAILAFEDNPPVIILPSGQILELSGLLMQVDEVKESPIDSIMTDDMIALEAKLDKAKEDLKEQSEALKEKSESLKAKEAALKDKEKELDKQEQQQSENQSDSLAEEMAEKMKLIEIDEDVDLSPSEENDYTSNFRASDDSSSAAAQDSVANVTATLEVSIGFYQTQKTISTNGDTTFVEGGGGSVRARYDASGEAQSEFELFDFSNSSEKMEIHADHSVWFEDGYLSRLISINAQQPMGFEIDSIIFKELPVGFEIIDAKDNGNGTWTIYREITAQDVIDRDPLLPPITERTGFTETANGIEIVLKYKEDTAHNDFSIGVEVNSLFDMGNVTLSPEELAEFTMPEDKELLGLVRVGIQVKEVNNPDDYIYDGNSEFGFVLSREPNENVILTSHGDTKVVGGRVTDIITAFEGNDEILAGSGDDTIQAGLGDDIIDGGEGVDTLDFQASSNGIDLSLLLGKSTGEG